MSTKIMPDTYEFNVSFISAIENYPLIYNSQMRDYTNRSKVEQAWQEISAQFDHSVELCKARWKNIRDSYLRHLRLQYRPATKPKKPYYLEPNMAFLKPFTRGGKRTPAGFPPSPSADDVDNSDYLACLEQDMQVASDLHVVSYQGGPVEQITPNDVPNEDENAEDSLERPGSAEEDSFEPARKLAKVDLLAVSSRYSGVEEEMLFFFTSLLPDMKNFSRKQIFRIKRKVLDLIEEVGTEE